MESLNLAAELKELNEVLEGYLTERNEYIIKRESIFQEKFMLNCTKTCYIALQQSLTTQKSEESKKLICSVNSVLLNLESVQKELNNMCEIVNSMIKSVDVRIRNIEAIFIKFERF